MKVKLLIKIKMLKKIKAFLAFKISADVAFITLISVKMPIIAGILKFKNNFENKIGNIFLSVSLNNCLWCSKESSISLRLFLCVHTTYALAET